MAGYKPLRIAGNSSGLIQEREEFLLPDDAYPTLQNAYVWRERIKRKKGYQLLGRLQRNIGTTDGAGNLVVAITPTPIQTGIVSFVIGADIFVDPGTTADPATQTLLTNSSGTGTLNRVTGVLTITGSLPNTAVQYYPSQPVMGIRIRELQNSAQDETIFFDQTYAYRYSSVTSAFEEFIPGTTWNASGQDVGGTDFFWSTNYWVSDNTNFPAGNANAKLFWVTNNTGSQGATSDPIRITEGTQWLDFVPPTYGQIDATNYLVNALSFLPFRGRLLMFNTWEGPTIASALQYSNRIRWSTIGNPFIPFSAGPPATGSWRDDIRGQGGFLDIPTSEDIVAVGFVRDNLVIYCERSTWQLRYTGRSIAPFQIERVNSEIGAESAFSAIQFDTSLLAIGDKGIIECDSYKAERIDIKIPDFVYKLQIANNGLSRIQGIRDFPNRLAYWTIPYLSEFSGDIPQSAQFYPNIRLVYNYENDSWALFNDSLTALGNFQPQSNRTWLNTLSSWVECDFPWIDLTAGSPKIVGGNQQGFVEYLDQNTTNDVSLYIQNIQADGVTPTIITIPNHNMLTGFFIGISSIQGSTEYTDLNGGYYRITVVNQNDFTLESYDFTSGLFNDVVAQPGDYFGGGLVNIRENFSIVSKKFNFLDQGQNIQLGYIDILMAATGEPNKGAISLNLYLDYDDDQISNTLPMNSQNNGDIPSIVDPFFNSVIPTYPQTITPNKIDGSKFWQRVFCATRASFLTLQYTFNNAQMSGIEQQLPVQIDAQILWLRKGGRMSQPF